jgi:hypothetical protein
LTRPDNIAIAMELWDLFFLIQCLYILVYISHYLFDVLSEIWSILDQWEYISYRLREDLSVIGVNVLPFHDLN